MQSETKKRRRTNIFEHASDDKDVALKKTPKSPEQKAIFAQVSQSTARIGSSENFTEEEIYFSINTGTEFICDLHCTVYYFQCLLMKFKYNYSYILNRIFAIALIRRGRSKTNLMYWEQIRFRIDG